MPANMKKAGIKYKKGGEKLLTKLTYGGMADMTIPMQMKYGGSSCKTPRSLKKK